MVSFGKHFFKITFVVSLIINDASFLQNNLSSCQLENKNIGKCVPKSMCSKQSTVSSKDCENEHFVCCVVSEKIVTPDNVAPIPVPIPIPQPLPTENANIIEQIDQPISGSIPSGSGNYFIFEEKCNEYSNNVTQKMEINFFIIGGTKTSTKKFPHMAALGFGTESNIQWLCGGSLISEQYVLTAAHCLKSQTLGEVKWVKLGTTSLDEPNRNINNYQIIDRIPNPQYVPPSQYNDIALVKINPVTFTDSIRPICLTNDNDLEYKTLIATGWGRTRPGGRQSQDLLEVNLEYYETSDCQKTYQYASKQQLPNGILDNMHICAGSSSDNRDTCQGDSGGPLQILEDKLYLVGVTSFGTGCGIVNSPGVYTKVSNYLSWIQNIVWANIK